MNIRFLFIIKTQDDLEDLMNSMKMIEFSLIGKLTKYFGVTYWDELNIQSSSCQTTNSERITV